LVLRAKKPKDSAYPTQIITLGDRLQAKRIDVGLEQKDMAIRLGVSEDSVCYRENNRVQPSKRSAARILDFMANPDG
jgi:DNA-binding XRE family transcriptional regulator